MSGTITDMALRVCWSCREVWMEDDRMYLDPNRCPHCGADACDNPNLFAHGGASGASPVSGVPDGAWELNDGSGYFELNSGDGYFESND